MNQAIPEQINTSRRDITAEKPAGGCLLNHSYPLHKGSVPSLAEFVSDASFPLLASSTFHRGISASDSLCGGGTSVKTSTVIVCLGLGMVGSEQVSVEEPAAGILLSGISVFDSECSFMTGGCLRLE